MKRHDVQKTQDWEKDWWGDCANTFNEEDKQFIYSRYMGMDGFLENFYGRRTWNLPGKSIIDIGGGPVSMLLKTKAAIKAVADPCDYPYWVADRYAYCDILYLREAGEALVTERLSELLHHDFDGEPVVFDEVWIYNVLQHVVDPAKIVRNARAMAKVVRVFEWVDQGVSPGHPHNLTKDNLDKWIGGLGKVSDLNERGCVGRAYHGVFKGDHYEE